MTNEGALLFPVPPISKFCLKKYIYLVLLKSAIFTKSAWDSSKKKFCPIYILSNQQKAFRDSFVILSISIFQ